MSLLNLNSTPSTEKRVQSLQSQSEGILDVFTSTKNQLEENTKQINELDHELADQIQALEEQRRQLSSTKKSNSSVVDQIDRFLNN